jgi:hypothetical protein
LVVTLILLTYVVLFSPVNISVVVLSFFVSAICKDVSLLYLHIADKNNYNTTTLMFMGLNKTTQVSNIKATTSIQNLTKQGS